MNESTEPNASPHSKGKTTFASLEGKTAVVTGSSSGIGQAVALELARGGAAVLVHARKNEKGAAETVETIQKAGGTADFLLADLAAPDEADRFVDRAWDWREGVDAWVNNAGADILTGGRADAPFDDRLRWVMEVDVMATIRVSRRIGTKMQAAGSGSIVQITWDGVKRGLAGDGGQLFSISKGAVAAFSRSLTQTVAPEVRVNCVAPGWIKTAWGQTAPKAWQQRAVADSLQNRWGTPEEIARTVRFLVSDAAGFLNGQEIEVNGGFDYH